MHRFPVSPSNSKSIPISNETQLTAKQRQQDRDEALAEEREWAMYQRISGNRRTLQTYSLQELMFHHQPTTTTTYTSQSPPPMSLLSTLASPTDALPLIDGELGDADRQPSEEGIFELDL